MLNSVFTTICTVLIAACLIAIVAMQALECLTLSVF